ncbi:MAG: hypothetical protein WKG06_21465 [Segetibacter sp.]
MTIIDKKKDIILTLQSSNNEQLIEEVYELLHPAEAVENIAVSNLPEDLQTKIYRALDDYNAGRYITHEQMKQKMQEWLMK